MYDQTLFVSTLKTLEESERKRVMYGLVAVSYLHISSHTLLQNVSRSPDPFQIKFVFSKKATKFDKIFTVDLTVTGYLTAK